MMDIVTRASIEDTVYYMNKNKIKVGTVNDILIKVLRVPARTVSDDDGVKIVISYKLLNESRVIESEYHYEEDVHLSKDALIQKLLLDVSIKDLT